MDLLELLSWAAWGMYSAGCSSWCMFCGQHHLPDCAGWPGGVPDDRMGPSRLTGLSGLVGR